MSREIRAFAPFRRRRRLRNESGGWALLSRLGSRLTCLGSGLPPLHIRYPDASDKLYVGIVPGYCFLRTPCQRAT